MGNLKKWVNNKKRYWFSSETTLIPNSIMLGIKMV